MKKQKQPKNVLEARRLMRNARVNAKQTIGAIDDALEAFAVLVPGGYVEACKALRTIANAFDGPKSAEYMRGIAKSVLKRIKVGEIADAVGASGEPS